LILFLKNGLKKLCRKKTIKIDLRSNYYEVCAAIARCFPKCLRRYCPWKYKNAWKLNIATWWYNETDLGPVSLKDVRLRPKFDYIHYFQMPVDLKIILMFLYKKKLGRCSYARNLKQNRQFCKLAQSTENSGHTQCSLSVHIFFLNYCSYKIIVPLDSLWEKNQTVLPGFWKR
jgi:hypothetical protein